MAHVHEHKQCQAQARANAEAICHQKGVRFTELRKQVLELIWESHEPAKAYDLLARIDQNTAAIKPPTIYRALDFLLEHGLIHKLDSLNAYIGCNHPMTQHDCYFLICSECGRVDECCDERFGDMISGVTAENDFQVKDVTFEMIGICGQCKH